MGRIQALDNLRKYSHQQTTSSKSEDYSEKADDAHSARKESPTPALDAFIAKPAVQQSLQQFTTALHGAVDRDTSPAALKQVVRSALGVFVVVRAEKMSGRVSKKEAKALKGEMKMLAKEAKRDFRAGK